MGSSSLSRAIKRSISYLDTTDLINVLFFAMLSIAMALWSEDVPLAWFFVLVNAGVIVIVFRLAEFSYTRKHIWKLFHGFYMMACIPIAFKEMYFLVPAIHPIDYDSALMAIDYAIFGVHPTHWIYRFQHSFLTEVLQLAYASFYLLPLILTVDLYRKKRMHAFRLVFLTVILGFYLSYIGYVSVPAIGPRFTLHDFHAINEELPGLLLTEPLRVYTDIGESIPPGSENVERNVQRDVFPSGHTQITLIVMIVAFRYRARSRWFLGVVGSLLIIATVYLRYHYVIDLVAGALFAFLTLQVVKFIDPHWMRKRAYLAHHLK